MSQPAGTDANGVLQSVYDPVTQALRVSGSGGSGAPTDAHYLTSQSEAGLSQEIVFGTSVFYPPDVVANRPSAGSTIPGAMFYATDTQILYRSDGSSTWTAVTSSGGTSALTSAHLFVGNASNVATDTAITGDITINNSGVTTLKNTGPGATGPLGTAARTNAVTIDAQGRVTALSDQAIQIAESAVTNLTTDLAAKQSTTLTSAHLLVGNGSNVATDTAVTGDVTISNAGVTTLKNTGPGATGPIGDATHVAAVTIDAQGRITALSSVAITGSADKLGLTPTAVKTTNYSAAAGDFVPADISSAGWTLTLPTAPADGTVIGVKVIAYTYPNVLTLQLGGSDVFNVAGGAQSGTLAILNQATLLQYKATGAIWYAVAADMPTVALKRYATRTFSRGVFR